MHMKNPMYLFIAVAIGLLMSLAGTARADDWGYHQKQANEWHQRHFHHRRGPAVIEEPNVVYAPPMIVEPPASGLNIIIPFNIR
jgi:hypothetical protein